MDGYRLRGKHGDTMDSRQPLPVIAMEGLALASTAPTLTYNGKAAAGAVSVNALVSKPIFSVEGDQVASFWGQDQNRVYSALAQNNPKKGDSWLLSIVETATSATAVIYDPNKNLELMFESLTTTVKRFVLKVTDTTGHSLYGWIMGVAVTADVYTFDVYNARVAETKSWVGNLTDFDSANLEKVEIFHYNSSLSFGTGTTFTEEVDCPKEFSKNWETQMEYAEGLSNGQYFVDYIRGRIIGKKADTTASEVVTYNIVSSSVSLSASDIEIGAVEMKDADTDNRANIKAANTARSTATMVLATQVIDEAGAVLKTSLLATAAKQPTLGTGVMAGSAPITIATDDTVMVNIKKALTGAGSPTAFDSYTHLPINLVAGANQSLVAAPGASKAIWVYGVHYTVNVAGTVSFQDEDDVALSGIMTHGINGGMTTGLSGNFDMPIWKVPTNKALEVDVVTSELDGWLDYAIISV